MNRPVRFCALAVAALLFTFPGCSRQEEQPKHAETKAAATPKDIWISQTTGKEYHVTTEGDNFLAEWVNVSPELSAHGSFMRTECKKQGDKWVGKTASYLPCTVKGSADGNIENWCHLETPFEVLSMTPDRITGKGGTLKTFDCAKCKIVDQGSADFLWTPKK